MNMIDSRLLVPVIVLVLLYAIGIAAYTHLEGWSVIDTVYFLTVTFTTVGYGDMIPQTPLGRLLTVFFCWSGVAVAIYTFGIISGIIKQNKQINRERIDRLKNRISSNPFSSRRKDYHDK